MFRRVLLDLLRRGHKSVLLLGPRQVGKSTLVRELEPELSIDLADEEQFLAFAAEPGLLRQRLAAARPRSVAIDEIQRLPRLLNTVQSILDEPRPPRFLLTGSSARKLRRGRANLLPGRLHTYQLGPLIGEELGDAYDEERLLTTGALPGIYADPDPAERKKTLRSYAATYVREEIQAEALTRNVEGFARFLRFAALGSGQFLDQTRLAREAAVPRVTVQRYYEVLEDTLLAHRVDAFSKGGRRRLVQHPRYFLFDVGVYNALVGNFQASGDRKGVLLEHLVVTQLAAMAAAFDAEVRLSSFRTEHGAEVDLIVEVGDVTWAIEVKASKQVGGSDLRGLRSFAEFAGRKPRGLVAYLGEHRRTIDGVAVWPYREVLREVAASMRRSA